MKIKFIATGIGLLFFAACGSPDTKKSNESQSVQSADSSSKNPLQQQDSSNQISDIKETHSERRENTLELSDSLKTSEFKPGVNTEDLAEKTGILRYSGNEPFVIPTLFETDSSSYRLVGDDEFLNKTFRELNGQTVALYGQIKEINNQKIMEVHYYKKEKN